MMAHIAYAFKWPLSELRALDLDELEKWHAEVLRIYKKSDG